MKKPLWERKAWSIKELVRFSLSWHLSPTPPTRREFFARWRSEYQEIVERHARINEARRADLEKSRAQSRASYHRHREKRVAEARAKRLALKSDPVWVEKYRKYTRERAAERAKTDIHFRLRKRLRGRILGALARGVSKSGATVDLIGCSVPEFKKHIESLWKPGMTWENYGRFGWHIDHVRPCASFDLTDPEQQRACFHYTNTQPLWHVENLKKGSVFNELASPLS